MQTMKNFAAQQLSKTQMNEVKGGDGGFDNYGTLYSVSWSGGTSYVCSKDKAAMKHFIDAGADFAWA